MKRFWGVLAAAVVFAQIGMAKDLMNGDFSLGKTGWSGDGKLVYVGPDGTTSPASKEESVPAMEIDLSNAQFRDISQKFSTNQGVLVVEGSLDVKASPDFKMNEKSSRFNKELTWGPGSTWYWTVLVNPRVDLVIRLEKPDGFCYKLVKLQPGADWQNVRFRFDNVGERKDVTLRVIGAPGEGKMWVKSINVRN